MDMQEVKLVVTLQVTVQVSDKLVGDQANMKAEVLAAQAVRNALPKVVNASREDEGLVWFGNVNVEPKEEYL